jgi:hypothetical protein
MRMKNETMIPGFSEQVLIHKNLTQKRTSYKYYPETISGQIF